MLTEGKPTIVGKRYILHELLGKGGMGAVYRATDRLTGEDVALKRVITTAEQIELSSSYNVVDFHLALAQEFKLSASLKHPNIIEVLDYGFDDHDSSAETPRQPYFTMELLDNPQTILQAGKGKPLPQQIELIVQMLQALAYLHRRGILHRDLKPGNVLVVNGQVKVLDFGLATMRERSSTDGEGGMMVGTLAYMAPEVLIGNPAGEAADLYAVGMIACELIGGKHPFEVMDIGKLINQVLYVPPDLSFMDVDGSLNMVLERLLQKTAEARYSSAGEVIAALSKATNRDLPKETAATRESFLRAARLVGRDQELDKLTRAMTDAKQGKGSAWLIGGENGVGKSRLVDELRTIGMVQGALVMRGQAVNVGRAPYRVWQPVVRWICLLTELDDVEAHLAQSILPDAAVLLKRTIPTSPELDLEPEAAQARLLKLLEKMLNNLKQPVVIIFEDLHWAGSESLAAITQFSGIVANLPVLVVATYRDDETPELPTSLPGIPVMKLPRLNEANIAELSQAMLGEGGSQPQVIDLLQRETEGNVFFLIEVVRALAEEAGNLEQIGLTTLPQFVFAGGVRMIIQRRLNRVTPENRSLLQVAAVMGRQIDLKLLRIIDPAMNIDTWLTECANAAVLDIQDGEWRFAHDRLRDGLLEDLPDDQCQALHRQVAGSIESFYGASVDQTVALAYHWGQGRDHAKEQYYVTLAGKQSLRTGAYREAVAFFERAFELISSSSDPTNEAVRLKQVELKHLLAEAHLGFGGYDQARHLYRDSLIICEEIGDPRGIAESVRRLGDVSYALSEFEQAKQLYQESRAMSEKNEDKVALAKVLNNLGNVAYELGDTDGAKQFYQESLELSRQTGSQWGMAGALTTQMTAVIPDQTNRPQAMKLLEDALEKHIQANNKHGIADTYYNIGILDHDSGDLMESRQQLRKALAIYQELNDPLGTAQCLGRLGAVSVALHRYPEAEQHYREALKTAYDAKATPMTLFLLSGIAALLNQQDLKERAIGLLAFVLYHPETQDRTQDAAERLLFDLEGNLLPAVVEEEWEKGKARTLDDVVKEILTTP